MYYYLVVSYNFTDGDLDEQSELCGPFKSVSAREKALKKDMQGRDLECTEEVNITMLTLRKDGLHRTRSFIPMFEDYNG